MDTMRLKSFYKSISSLFATLPGIAALVAGLAVPPDISKILFAGVLEFFGVLSLVIVLFNDEPLKKLSRGSITKASIWLGIFSLVALFSYLILLNVTVVDHPIYDPIQFPLWSQGDLVTWLSRVNENKFELVEMLGRQGVKDIIDSSSKTGLIMSHLLLLFTYLLIFLPFVVAFNMMAVRMTAKNANPNRLEPNYPERQEGA